MVRCTVSLGTFSNMDINDLHGSLNIVLTIKFNALDEHNRNCADTSALGTGTYQSYAIDPM